MRRLVLKGPPRPKFALSLDYLFDGRRAQCSDQLILQVDIAHEETQLFHLRAAQIVAEAGPHQSSLDSSLFGGVVKPCQPDVVPRRSEHIQELSDVGRTTHRNDVDRLLRQVPTTASGQHLQGYPVANPFHQDDGWLHAISDRPRNHERVRPIALGAHIVSRE